MNTCKSVSKQATLTPFRMNTCEKPGEGIGAAKVKRRIGKAWKGKSSWLWVRSRSVNHGIRNTIYEMITNSLRAVRSVGLPTHISVLKCPRPREHLEASREICDITRRPA